MTSTFTRPGTFFIRHRHGRQMASVPNRETDHVWTPTDPIHNRNTDLGKNRSGFRIQTGDPFILSNTVARTLFRMVSRNGFLPSITVPNRWIFLGHVWRRGHDFEPRPRHVSKFNPNKISTLSSKKFQPVPPSRFKTQPQQNLDPDEQKVLTPQPSRFKPHNRHVSKLNPNKIWTPTSKKF